MEAYFAGNDVACNNHKTLDCKPLCSKYCWSRKVEGDRFCDVECNSETCNYDGGDCA